jgi:hypothetical protein
MAVVALVPVLLIATIRGPAPPGARTAAADLGRELLLGFRTIGLDARVRLLISLYTLVSLVAGVLNVLVVTVSFEFLDFGKSGVGFLNSALGGGGFLGAIAALALASRRRLAGAFGVGILLWGLPIALVAASREHAAALGLLALVGVGNTVVDVAALTLLQRSVPNEVLGRVFGVVEALVVASIGVGAILAPALIGAAGIQAALVATGCVLPAAAALSWRRLAAIDRAAEAPERKLELLRGSPIFQPLPVETLEALAAHLVPEHAERGSIVIRAGEPGDRFYIVDKGHVEVRRNGRRIALLGPGDFFGEIALLRATPRTALVVARDEVDLYTLGRDDFVAAVSGHPDSARVADAVVSRRLRALRWAPAPA